MTGLRGKPACSSPELLSALSPLSGVLAIAGDERTFSELDSYQEIMTKEGQFGDNRASGFGLDSVY